MLLLPASQMAEIREALKCDFESAVETVFKFCPNATRDEAVDLANGIEAIMHADIASSLDSVFGREWLRLSEADKAVIIRDCIEEGGVTDFAQYRRNIGTGHLDAYARTMHARFNKDARR